MPDRQDIAVQRNGFNAQESAFNQGIRVDSAVVFDFVSYWLVADRAVLIQADLSGHVRNEVIAHAVAHIEMAESRELAAALDGERWRGRIEMQVHDVVAHRLIPIADLRDALEVGDNLTDVSALLGVTEFLLGWRLQHLLPQQDRIARAGLGIVRGHEGRRHHRLYCILRRRYHRPVERRPRILRDVEPALP